MSKISIGVDHLSVIGMPPVDFISVAKEAGLSSVSLFYEQRTNPLGFPDWSLISDARLRREVVRRLDDTGMILALGEGCVLKSDTDVKDLQSVLDIFTEIGAPRVGLVSFEADPDRETEQQHRLAEMASARNLELCVECSRRRKLEHLANRIDGFRPLEAGIVIDAMHFFRAGESINLFSRFDPRLFAYLQICDVPLRTGVNIDEAEYREEALHKRLPPGEGELPLEALVAALPEDITISMEIPQLDLALKGIPHVERLRYAADRCRAVVEGARRLSADH